MWPPAPAASSRTSQARGFKVDTFTIAENTAVGKLAVFGVAAPHLAANTQEGLTELILTAASTVPGISAIGKSDVEAMLGFEKTKDLVGCDDNLACMAEIGAALDVDGLLVTPERIRNPSQDGYNLLKSGDEEVPRHSLSLLLLAQLHAHEILTRMRPSL